MAASGVIGTVAADRDNSVALVDLRQQIGQRLASATGIARNLDRSDIEAFRVDTDVHLAPLTTVANTVFPSCPFTLTDHLDPGASTSKCRPTAQIDRQTLLAQAQSRIIRRRPVQTRHLPRRELERRLQPQSDVDRPVRKPQRPTMLTIGRPKPVHPRFTPNIQRASPLQRRVILGAIDSAILRQGRSGPPTKGQNGRL